MTGLPGRIMLMVIGAGVVAGCSDVRGTFGLGQQTPDEFAVVSRAPLAVPPEYSMRPPEPGAPRPQEGTASDQARSAFGGEDLGPQQVRQLDAGGQPSSGEAAILGRAGADRVDGGVRARVDREAGDIFVADQNFVERLMFWRDPGAAGDVVDPEREVERLSGAVDQGRPINEGEIPTIERRGQGILGGFF